MMALTLSLAAAAGLAAPSAVALRAIRRRHMDRWLPAFLAQSVRRRRISNDEPIDLLLCIADHYEPKGGGATPGVARARVDRWLSEYPRLLERFADSDGRPPRHSFFYPIDEYEAEYLDDLASLCRRGFGEVEVHLHHDNDTADNLRQTLEEHKELWGRRHGLLPTCRATGERKFGFIHGNWALDNARPDGRWCGVNNELDVLRLAGCYADFTLPSAPSPTQTRKINSIYYAVDDPARPHSHDRGMDVGRGPRPADGLLMVQGPLTLHWTGNGRRLRPRIENGCLQANQPPTAERIDQWLKAAVQVHGRPDWFFVKLHTHGAPEANSEMLLGDAMVAFHRELANRASKNPLFRFHYVTAREMANLVRAAESGWTGSVEDARNLELVWE